MKLIARRDVLLLVVAIHAAIDVALIAWGTTENLPDTSWGMAIAYSLIAWPMSQGCLLAIWAATGRMRFSLRLPLALAGTAIALIALFKIFAHGGPYSPSPVFAFILITQLLATLLLIGGGRLVHRLFRHWRSGWTEISPRFTQFSLRQLLIWTAVLALILGTAQGLSEWLGWTTHILRHQDFQAYRMLALYNVLSALLVFGVFIARVRWPVRILLFPLAVAACGALMWLTLLLTGRLYGPRSSVLLVSPMLAAPQFLYHTMTLWPLWLCGHIGPHDDTSEA